MFICIIINVGVVVVIIYVVVVTGGGFELLQSLSHRQSLDKNQPCSIYGYSIVYSHK